MFVIESQKDIDEYVACVDQLTNSILDNKHNLSDAELSTCKRVLYHMKTTLYAYNLSMEKSNNHNPIGGALVPIARDIVFLMRLLSFRSSKNLEPNQIIEFEDPLNIINSICLKLKVTDLLCSIYI